MLREATTIRTPEGHIRRWFYDDSFDLVVWLDPEEKAISAFELCYCNPAVPQIEMRWSAELGFEHLVQEEDKGVSRHKGTAVFNKVILSAHCPSLLDGDSIAQFHVTSLTLPPSIRDFILDKLDTLS